MIDYRTLNRFLDTFKTEDKSSRFEMRQHEYSGAYTATLIVEEKINMM